MSRSKILFCFDRDETITTGEGPGPVPIEWVRYLARETHHAVWASGNQKLRREAEILGFHDIDIDEWATVPREEMGRRIQRLTAIAAYVEHNGTAPSRKIVVDDIDLTPLEEYGWEYYTPQEFVEEFRSDIDI